MALKIRDAQVERLAADVPVGHSPGMDRASRALAYLEREVWPLLPPGERGRTLSKAEEEVLLGLGPEGV